MQLSDCLQIIPDGTLIYKGQDGALHEVLGGRNGFLFFRRYLA